MNTDKSDAQGMAEMLVETRGFVDARKFAMMTRLQAMSEAADAESDQNWEDFGIFRAELEFWREVSKCIAKMATRE